MRLTLGQLFGCILTCFLCSPPFTQGEALCTVKLPAPVVSAHVHPYNKNVAVVTLANAQPPHLVRFGEDEAAPAVPLPLTTNPENSTSTVGTPNAQAAPKASQSNDHVEVKF